MGWFWNSKKDSEVVEIDFAQAQQQQSWMKQVINQITRTIRRSSSGVYGISPDGKRNYNELYGYGESLSYSDFYSMFKRGGIASAVVEKLPKACWRANPRIQIGEDEDILKDEMKVLKKIGFFKALERADILNRIGPFSVLLIGVPDGLDLDQPVGTANSMDGFYFNPYGYNGVEIIEWDRDPASPRYSLPLIYQLTSNRSDNDSEGAKNVFQDTLNVHYSRIIHMAEGALDNKIEGRSSLEAPWNALLDKDKVRGGSGEAYFRNARQKLSLEADSDFTMDRNKEAIDQLKENVNNFQNGWEDVLRLQGMKANMLQPALTSPRDPFDVCIEEISGATGIPVRWLTSKGSGNLTGSEDQAAWNGLVIDRAEQECGPWLLEALQIFSNAGVLDLPETAEVFWPPQSALTEKEEAEVGKTNAQNLETVSRTLSALEPGTLDPKQVFKQVKLRDIEVEEGADFTTEEPETDSSSKDSEEEV